MTTNEITINKMVINIGTGNDSQIQLNAKRLLEVITGRIFRFENRAAVDLCLAGLYRLIRFGSGARVPHHLDRKG